MNDFLVFVLPVFVVLTVLASLGELAVSGMWMPAYYRYGIPLFRKEYPLTTMPDLAAKIPELEQKLKRSMWRPSIVFRALDENNIAFRNNFGSRNAMSGLIRLEPNQRRMRISGHLNWTVFLMPLIFLVMVFVFPLSAIFIFFLLAIFMLTFWMQRQQYEKIAAVIVETAVSAQNLAEPIQYNPKPERILNEPLETVNYNPEFDPYKPPQPQTGLSNTEMALIIALMALVAVGCVAGFLLVG